MKRSNLDALDREALIRLAEEHGVTRPRILTRPELVDEILQRSTPEDGADASLARGFFGLARDLVARVVERGLHLPDAASRIRSLAVEGPRRPPRAAVLPTVTLAQIYAAQGHTERAVETLRRVLLAEPEHADARALLAELEDAAYVPPKEPLPPEPDELGASASAEPEEAPPVSAVAAEPVVAEPVVADSSPTAGRLEASSEAGTSPGSRPSEGGSQRSPMSDSVPPPPPPPPQREPPEGMLDDSPLPPRYDVTECVAIPVDPETLFVYWEVRAELVARVRAARGHGVLALRALVIEPGWHGPRTTVRDHDVHADFGDYFLRDLPSASVVRVAVGYRTDDAFVPLTHSPLLELPRRAPVERFGQTLVRWTPGGAVPVDDERLGELVAHATERARAEQARLEQKSATGADRCTMQANVHTSGPLGSS